MKKVRVLFLGNSHTYFNDLPIIFRDLAAAGGKEADVQLMAYPGVTYE